MVRKMVKIKAKAKWVENVQSIADNTRGHGIVMDLGTESGGTNAGPSGLELAMMSLADCVVVIFAEVCKNSNVEPSKIEVMTEAEKTSDSPIITSVNMKVTLAAKARKQKVDALWRRTEANCPVLSIFQETIPVNIEVETIAE